VKSTAVCKSYQDMNAEALINDHGVLVKRIAHHLMGRLPNTIQVDDLIQAGMIGLLDAAKNYNVEKGASFETYAGIRIRGNMLDEVRRGNWVPRSVHREARRISETIHQLEHQFGRDVRDLEVAEALDISLDDYHEMLCHVSSSKLFSIDDLSNQESILNENVVATMLDPFEGVHFEKFCMLFIESIEQLPEREKLVLSLYYDEDLNLKEIGAVLDVSESRICQIHSQAMLRLNARLKEWKQS